MITVKTASLNENARLDRKSGSRRILPYASNP